VRLSEAAGKAILDGHGLRIPGGQVARSPEEASAITVSCGGTSVIKAMVPAGGRGKAGLVRLVNSPSEAFAAARDILGRSHAGCCVTELLVERQLAVAAEFYLSIVLDPWQEGLVMMFSPEGGVDIETVARSAPERVLRVPVHPERGLLPRSLPDLLERSGAPHGLATKLSQFARKLAALGAAEDLLLAEVNPLVLTVAGGLVAADCKMEVDDAAVYRHPEHRAEADASLGPDERQVRSLGGTLVSLESGDIGIICNGAGMGMAMLDMFRAAGLKAANFLDTGGGLTQDRAHGVCSVMFRNRGLRGVLVNIWGGFTRLDEVARGIAQAFREEAPPYPLVVKLIGLNQGAAVALMSEIGVQTVQEVETEKAVALLASIVTGLKSGIEGLRASV